MRSTYIAEDLWVSNVLPRAEATSSIYNIHITKFLLRFPAALGYIERYDKHVFRVTHFQYHVLFTCIGEVVALKLDAACQYLTKHKKRKENCFYRSLCVATSSGQSIACCLFLGNGNESKYDGRAFQYFLNTRNPVTRSFSSTMQAAFLNKMKLFDDSQCGRERNQSRQNLNIMNSNTGCVLKHFFKASSTGVVSPSVEVKRDDTLDAPQRWNSDADVTSS